MHLCEDGEESSGGKEDEEESSGEEEDEDVEQEFKNEGVARFFPVSSNRLIVGRVATHESLLRE